MSQSEHANTTFILSRFPNLKMIYLHGNKISSLTDLSRLTLLPNLYSLTLHGWVLCSILHRKYALHEPLLILAIARNPLENSPNYRSSVLKMLPYLRSLDFAKGEFSFLSTIWTFFSFSIFQWLRGRERSNQGVAPESRKRLHFDTNI